MIKKTIILCLALLALFANNALAKETKKKAEVYSSYSAQNITTVNSELNTEQWSKKEERYLSLHNKFAQDYGDEAAGRNLLLQGYKTDNGVRFASDRDLQESISSMQSTYAIEEADEAIYAEAESIDTDYYESTESTESTSSTYGAPDVIECESGGDYSAVNEAGYYGAYQFDQSTWDAYAPEGYAGVNPAEAPPEIQDQTAASVDYDAWPNC